jgi:hypothetical protein
VFANVSVEIVAARTAIHQVVDGTGELNVVAGEASQQPTRPRHRAPRPTLTFGAEQTLVRHSLGSDPTV